MRRILFILFTLALPTQVFALASEGHQLVCDLAYQHLTPKTKHKVDALLAKIPRDQVQVINKYLKAPIRQKISFAKSCNWADAIKRNKKYDAYKPWHYINVDRDQKHITAHSCKKDCVTTAIATHVKQMNQAKRPWQKLQALMFLGHWLGDIHQPLHVSFASDWGGNKVNVSSPDGKCTNMHWLWDQCLISRSNLSYEQLLAELNNQWQQAPIATWQHSTIAQWADESLQISLAPSTQYCQMENGVCQQPKQEVKLADDYQQVHNPMLETRMVQAAARLTALLERFL